jgi:hypothetical protein
LSELRTSRVRAPRQASPRSPAARSADRTSTCGPDVRLGSRAERTPPPRGPPPTRSDPGIPLKYYPPPNRQPGDDAPPATLALTAPTRSRTTPTLRTTAARTALPPTRAGRGAGIATGQSPALTAKTAASPPLRSSSRTTASDPVGDFKAVGREFEQRPAPGNVRRHPGRTPIVEREPGLDRWMFVSAKSRALTVQVHWRWRTAAGFVRSGLACRDWRDGPVILTACRSSC